MSTREDLDKKLLTLYDLIDRKQWKFYFLESLGNFIYYLDEIKSEGARDKATDMINSCLKEIDHQYRVGESISKTYKYLFATYIYYLGNIYKTQLGFITKPYYPVDILILIVVFFAVSALSNFIFSAISVVVIIAFYLIRAIPKIKNRKYY